MRFPVIAAMALAVIGPTTVRAAELDRNTIPDHIQALKNEDKPARLQAVRALGNFGTAAKTAVNPLGAAMFEDKDPEVRAEVVRALGRIGPAAVQTLEKAVQADDAVLRLQAIRALGKIGPAAKEAAPALVEALKDRDIKTRARAAFVLGEIAADPEIAAPSLVAALRSSDRDLCVQAANSLIRFGPAAVAFLAQGLKEKDSGTRYWSAYALGMIGPEAKEAVPALMQALKDRDRRVHLMAIAALGEIGPAAEPAVERLILELKDKKPEATKEKKQDAAKEKKSDVQKQAAASLAFIGRPAVPHLIEIVEKEDAALRSKALVVLGMIGSDAKDAVPVLTDLLGDRDMTSKVLACLALAQIGPEARQAIPKLTPLLDEKDHNVQVGAALALARIEPNNAKAQARLDAEIDRLRYSKGSAGRLAQLNRQRQAAIERFIDLFVYLESFDFGHALKWPAKLETMQLGPEAIPALVRALNKLQENPDGKTVVAERRTGPRTFFFI